jgi:8-oxo-dGTP pyrophosphatase MutT (NUDIX family)
MSAFPKSKHPPISKKELIVNFKNEYSLTFPKQTGPYFHHEWNEQVKKAEKRNSILFNGPLSHVSKWEMKDDKLFVHLGNTDYKSYVCTRTKEFKEKFPDIPTAKPLAVCVALITSDKKLIIEKRNRVDIYDGYYHVAGGFLDPKMDLDNKGIPDPVKGIVREVKEEVGLEIDSNGLILLGLAEDTIVPHYELCYLLEMSLSSPEVQSNFDKAKTDGEFNYPIFIDYNKESINTFLKENNEKISPTGRECLIMAVNFSK